MFGKIYETTWWGNPTQTGWGNIYYDLAAFSNYFVRAYNERVLADGGIVEALRCVEDALDLQSNPIITLLGSPLLTSRVNTIYTDAGATAFDNIFYGDITDLVEATNNVNINKAGAYDVVYNLTDLSGRAAPSVVRDVYVTSVLVNRYDDRVLADGGTMESLQCADFDYSVDWVSYLRGVDNAAKFIEEYTSRITLDGGILEAEYCVENSSLAKAEWMYYYRVLDDLGIVESIGCVKI